MTPYHQGMQACRNKKELTDNPFADTNDRAKSWADGWWYARLFDGLNA